MSTKYDQFYGTRIRCSVVNIPGSVFKVNIVLGYSMTIADYIVHGAFISDSSQSIILMRSLHMRDIHLQVGDYCLEDKTLSPPEEHSVML